MRLNLRFENNPHSIASLIRELQVHKTSLTLWQNLVGDRILAQAFVKHIDGQQKLMSLSPFKKNFMAFDRKETIFGYTEFKSIVFKTTINNLDSNLIACPLPENIRLIELRNEPRLNFELEFNPPEIITESNNVFRLFDLSQKGASFIIPRSLLGKYFVDDRLHLSPLTMSFKDQFHEAKIKHISPYYRGLKNPHQFFRIGVQFKYPVSVEEFIGGPKNQAG